MSPNYDFIRHSIDVLLGFLMANELSQPLLVHPTKTALATTAVDLLLRLISSMFIVFPSPPTLEITLIFPVYPLENDNCVLFSEPQSLVKRLLNFIEEARSSTAPTTAQHGQRLVCHSFAVLVEASMRDHTFWTAVKDEVKIDELIKALLLEQQHQISRNDVAERINKACSSSKPSKQSPNGKTAHEESVSVSSTESPSHIDMLATIWQSLVNIIPNTLYYANQSAEFFKVSLSVFTSVMESTHCDMTLDHYVNQWSDVLFKRLTLRTEEVSRVFLHMKSYLV